jgi:hypothetical protein
MYSSYFSKENSFFMIFCSQIICAEDLSQDQRLDGSSTDVPIARSASIARPTRLHWIDEVPGLEVD